MKKRFLLFFAVIIVFQAFACACAKSSTLDIFIDIAEVLEKTSLEDVPEAMRQYFSAVNRACKETPEIISQIILNEFIKLETEIGPYKTWSYELKYVFSQIDMKLDWKSEESSTGYIYCTLLPTDSDVTEDDAIALAWDKIMEVFFETEDRINSFYAYSWFYEATGIDDSNKGVYMRNWKIEFYLKETTDSKNPDTFWPIGDYWAEIDALTMEVIVDDCYGTKESGWG